MEELKQKSEPGMAFVGVLLLIVFGILISNDRPVQSPRPYDTPYPRPLDRNLIDHSYESWPWEDPFDFKPGEIQERDLYQIDTGNLRDLINLDSNKKQELQIKLHKSLDVHGFSEDKTKSSELCNDQFEEERTKILEEISNQSGKKPTEINKSTKVLISVVKVHPRTIENKENRTRQRYAVTAGLTASGYSASQPNRLHFCTSHKEHDEKYNVRWEHFWHKNDQDDVIVVWITHNTEIDTFLGSINTAFIKNNRNIDSIDIAYVT